MSSFHIIFNMNRTLIILLFFCNITYGQIMSDEQIDESNIIAWTEDSKEAYEGAYFFGFSEVESQFTLSVDEDVVCAQVRSYEWVESEDDNIIGWKPVYENYTNVSIEGNKFFSDQSNGEFVLYNNQKCLKLDTPPFQMGDEGDFELGERGDKNYSEYYSGRFTQTIFEIVEEDVLRVMSPKDLQIMRNEIFARYGYVFISGGKMDTYFKRQDWYSGIYENVDEYLTEIEKINIANIQKLEEEK